MADGRASSNGQTKGKTGLVGKAGMTGGSVLSILGTLILLLGFFILPWVSSCTGEQLTGYELAVNGSDMAEKMGEDIGVASYALMCIPGAGLMLLGLSVLLIPAAFVGQVPRFLKTAGSAATLLLASFACCISAAFLAYMQSILDRYKSVLEMESGFWVTVFGVVLALAGTLVSTASAVYAHVKEK